MHLRIFAAFAGLILTASYMVGGEPVDSDVRTPFIGSWTAITGPPKWLKLQVDGTASLMPFVNHPDYLLSGTFDCTGGIVYLRFVLPYCRDAGPENPGLYYHSKYEAHLEEDELVICQTESFAGDCREPDFRCRKEPPTVGSP